MPTFLSHPQAPTFGRSWIKDPKGFDIIKGCFWLQHQDEEVRLFWTDVTFIFKCRSYNCLQMWGTYFRNTQKGWGWCDQRRLGLILEYHMWRWIFKNTFSVHFWFQRKASTSCGYKGLSLFMCIWTLRHDPSAEEKNSGTKTLDGFHYSLEYGVIRGKWGHSPPQYGSQNNHKKYYYYYNYYCYYYYYHQFSWSSRPRYLAQNQPTYLLLLKMQMASGGVARFSK